MMKSQANKPKSIIGKPMTEADYEKMINDARKSKSYRLKEAKQYLNVRLNS
jgi:vacuolar-type H+-ATPase subunit H